MDISLTPLFVLATVGFLGWGFWQSRQRGKVGILSWLQGVTLLLPWVVFLGLFSVGLTLGSGGFILLLVVSTGLYIGFGRWARQAFGEALVQQVGTDAQTADADATEVLPEPPPLPDIPQMQAADLTAVSGIFSIDTFFATETIPYGEGVIYRGNLRTEATQAVAGLKAKLATVVGDRYTLYLVQDQSEKPAVVVLPTQAVDQPASPVLRAFAAGLLTASVLTTTELGANLTGFSLTLSPGRWLEALPITVGLGIILAVHEAGHRWQAQRHGVRLSIPFVIPTLGLGTLGSLTRIESPVPTRAALFDIAFAGPALGAVVSLLFLLVGLTLPGEIYLPTPIFQNSILVGTLARAILGNQLQGEVVAINAAVAVGWIGLTITALSLLPAGQLDGGRIMQAIYGRKTAGRATFVTLVVLAIAAVGNLIALYWALLVLFIAREPERPPQNEITETDGQRDALALLALFVMAMTLLPIAPSLAGRLGIG